MRVERIIFIPLTLYYKKTPVAIRADNIKMLERLIVEPNHHRRYETEKKTKITFNDDAFIEVEESIELILEYI